MPLFGAKPKHRRFSRYKGKRQDHNLDDLQAAVRSEVGLAEYKASLRRADAAIARNRAHPAKLPGPSEKLLQVKSSYFTAAAVWKRINGVWSCVKAAPIIRWMRGMTPDQAKLALVKMGADFQWISPSPGNMSHAGHGAAQPCDPSAGTTPLVGDNLNQTSNGSGRETAASVASPSLQTGGSTTYAPSRQTNQGGRSVIARCGLDYSVASNQAKMAAT